MKNATTLESGFQEKHTELFGTSKSIFADTIFYNGKLTSCTVLEILYHWVMGARRMKICKYVGVSAATARSTLTAWYQIMQEDLVDEDCSIGGIDANGVPIITEIDESKFGKVNYHRAHRVEGVWVVGDVERTPQRKCFLVKVTNRNTATMNALIEKYVKKGSRVFTDCWRAYNDMANLDLDLTHETVTHSETFRDGDVCTNTIEGTWSSIKVNVFPANRNKKIVPWLLVEFIWRRKHAGDIWEGVMKVLKDVSYDQANINPACLAELLPEEDE